MFYFNKQINNVVIVFIKNVFKLSIFIFNKFDCM